MAQLGPPWGKVDSSRGQEGTICVMYESYFERTNTWHVPLVSPPGFGENGLDSKSCSCLSTLTFFSTVGIAAWRNIFLGDGERPSSW